MRAIEAQKASLNLATIAVFKASTVNIYEAQAIVKGVTPHLLLLSVHVLEEEITRLHGDHPFHDGLVHAIRVLKTRAEEEAS